MCKFKLNIREVRSYNHSVTIETDLNEEALNIVLNDIERNGRPFNFEEYYMDLKQRGIKILETDEDIDGDKDEIECDDLAEEN